jgi:hypothetical protein
VLCFVEVSFDYQILGIVAFCCSLLQECKRWEVYKMGLDMISDWLYRIRLWRESLLIGEWEDRVCSQNSDLLS